MVLIAPHYKKIKNIIIVLDILYAVIFFFFFWKNTLETFHWAILLLYAVTFCKKTILCTDIPMLRVSAEDNACLAKVHTQTCTWVHTRQLKVDLQTGARTVALKLGR